MKSENQKRQNQSSRSQNSPNSNSQEEQEEEADLYQPQGSSRQEVERDDFSSYWDDLLKLLQLTVIVVLIIFIFLMGYMIVTEIRQFWFSSKEDSFAKAGDIKLIENERKSANGEDDQGAETQNESQEMEKALVETSRQENLRLQNEKNQKTVISTPDKSQKRFSVSNQKKSEVYDPVLIQLNKYKERIGSKYKQTIYTMKNTSITQAQYLRSKNLIELTKFYNPKEKKFILKENEEGQSCGPDDQTCEKKQTYIDSIEAEEISYYEEKYRLTQINFELPFCIIVPSYKNNHGKNIFRNLNSIFQQKYDNFHVVYIDDASKDGTSEVVKEYVQKYDIKDSKLLFIQNSQNQKALKNIYTAAHEKCNEKEIMIIVDGDDYLIGTQVLRFLNYQYQTKTLLAAYTNYLRINEPYYIKVGTSTPYPHYVLNRRSFRKTPNMFRASHLRSYYVDLFRKIKPEDLKDEKGEFFTAANDFAIMMPVLEMASPHIEYLPELTYLYDSGTGLNNFQSKKQVQKNNVKIVSRRRIYNKVDLKEFYFQK